MEARDAEILALKALRFLAESDGGLNRFVAGSGLAAADLRRLAREPETLAAVMDFLLSDEGLLLQFCQAEELDPRAVQRLRAQLPGSEAA